MLFNELQVALRTRGYQGDITVEDLIEATGTRYMFRQSHTWTATFQNLRGHGCTLDLALAHLWLALNARREQPADHSHVKSDA